MDVKPWNTLSTQTLVENEHVTFKVDEYETMDGSVGKYWYLGNPGEAVAVIGQLSDDQFVLVREYRYVIGKISLEHIGAGVEPGESPEQAAAREMQEEAGYKPGSLVRLGGQHSLPGQATEWVDVYLARDLEPVERSLEPSEQIEPVILSGTQIDEAIRSGEVIDGITITAWFRVKQFLNG